MNAIRIKYSIVATLVLIAVVTCIRPIYPDQLVLQQLGTLVVLLPLLIDLKKNRFSLLAFGCFALFIVIHLIGARWIYSYVPYEDWLSSLFGIEFDSGGAAGRNHYDRFVHASFGVLIFPWIYELLKNKIASVLMVILFTWCVIQTISLLYESFEWLLTAIVSSEASTNYNGQQGDPWDAQKDMALALLGSSTMSLIYWVSRFFSRADRKAFR